MKIDVKSIITYVALVLWIAVTVAGIVMLFKGNENVFLKVFEFFSTSFAIILAFFFGTKIGKKEAEEEQK